MKVFILFSLLAGVAYCQQLDVAKAFKDSSIAPDVVSQVPQNLLQVKYSKTGKEVKLGNELAPKDVRDAPEVRFQADPASFYTLIMTDPDAPSRKNPTSREWSHWLVGNIPGSDIGKGQTLTEYMGAGPPKNTGLHRYVFLLYKQSGKLTFDEQKKTAKDSNRAKFSAEKFAKKYNLGNPVAGNFFQAQYDGST